MENKQKKNNILRKAHFDGPSEILRQLSNSNVTKVQHTAVSEAR